MTHTYAILEVSQKVFDEIKHRLKQVDYHHTFGTDDGAPIIDMHGIALKAEGKTAPKARKP